MFLTQIRSFWASCLPLACPKLRCTSFCRASLQLCDTKWRQVQGSHLVSRDLKKRHLSIYWVWLRTPWWSHHLKDYLLLASRVFTHTPSFGHLEDWQTDVKWERTCFWSQEPWKELGASNTFRYLTYLYLRNDIPWYFACMSCTHMHLFIYLFLLF